MDLERSEHEKQLAIKKKKKKNTYTQNTGESRDDGTENKTQFGPDIFGQ